MIVDFTRQYGIIIFPQRGSNQQGIWIILLYTNQKWFVLKTVSYLEWKKLLSPVRKKKIRENFLEIVKYEKVYDWVVLNHLEKGKIFFFPERDSTGEKNWETYNVYGRYCYVAKISEHEGRQQSLER